MKNFSVRVELLNDANGQDYADLHQRMRNSGFDTVIAFRDGSKAHLPPAEYVHSVNGLETVLQVRDRASNAVSIGLRFGLSYRIYAVEIIDWAGHNLVRA